MAIDDRAIELFRPRGLEASVPGLARIRRDVWPHLSEKTRVVLEVADYVGLDRAVTLSASMLEWLEGILPEGLLDRWFGLITAAQGAPIISRSGVFAELRAGLKQAN